MKIAVLGPSGTFSESALNAYITKTNLEHERIFFSSIPATFKAIGKECEIGIVPVENTLDGYVQRSLDMLLEEGLSILDEVIIPIKFSLISNVKNKEDIKKIYVQFKANGQCLKFINSFNDVQIINTQSNTESYNLFIEDNKDSCAIIPNHMLFNNGFYFIEDVTDSTNNFTRFFIIEKEKTDKISKSISKEKVKASLYIMPEVDRSGLLYEILKVFNDSNINLSSIISRPTKKNLGTYNFYIELSFLNTKLDSIINTLYLFEHKYNIKILGIY